MSIFVSGHTTSTAIAGLPGWMTDGKLLGGDVQTSCKLRTPLPGLPLMCSPVPAEFMHAVNDFMFTKTAVCGANNVCYIAEDTVNGEVFSAAFIHGKVSVMKDGQPIKGSNVLPLRMIFLLSFPFYMQDKEFDDALNGLRSAANDGERQSYMAILADNAHERDAQNEVSTSYEAYTLTRMTKDRAATANYVPSIVYGEASFRFFQNPSTSVGAMATGNISASKSVMSGSEFNGAFRVVAPEDLTEEERQHVPVLDDNVIITKQLIDVCRAIQLSMKTRHPFENILLRGLPGGGKSTFVYCLAAGLGLPYYSDVMRTDMSDDFFSGYYAPNTDRAANDKTLQEFLSKMPSSEDMAYDSAAAYEKITGKKKVDATPLDCQVALAKRAQQEGHEDALIFVEGLIPKLERPCLVFYDEVTAPKNPATITALNTIMDRQRKFTLSSGRVINRAPLTIMCFAGNFSEDGIELEGAHDPNRTWMDRCNLIIDVAPPTPAEIKAKLIADTGYDESVNSNIPIDIFVSIMPELQKISADFFGVCGFRAIADWLALAMITGSPIQAAEYTAITKSANDKACQAELRQKIKNRFRF